MQRLVFLIGLVSITAVATVKSRNEIGLGFTDNANLIDVQMKSDFFLKVGTSHTWTTGEHKPQLQFSYRDYFKENANDLFAWRVSDRMPLDRNKWQLKFGGFGNHYVNSPPGTTDESFSNVGADAKLERTRKLTSRAELTFGPGVQVRKYIQASDRTDNTVLGNAMLEYEASPVVMLDSLVEVGVLISNQSEYSRAYLSLEGGVDYTFKKDWNWYTNLNIRESKFLSRTITQETLTTRTRKGALRQAPVESKEAYSTVSLTSEVMHSLNEHWRSGIELSWLKQSSLSGLENYAAVGFYARLLWIF
jgi:hypothetical protein